VEGPSTSDHSTWRAVFLCQPPPRCPYPDSQFSSDTQRSPEILAPFCAPSLAHPVPTRPLTWGQRSTFRTPRAPQPARAVHSPSAVLATTPPPRHACSPRIPGSTRILLSSLARGPLLARELVLPSTGVRLLQAPGWDFPGSGLPRPERAVFPWTPLPTEGLEPHTHSGLSSRGCISARGSLGVPGDLARPGPMHTLPEAPCHPDALAPALRPS
jgi:hypothetical protein